MLDFRSPTSPYRHVDFLLVGAVGAITALGLVMVYSATRNSQAVTALGGSYYVSRQALFVGIGVVLMIVMVMFDYRVLQEVAPVVYGITVFVLLVVLTPIGSSARGAQAWFELAGFQFEPSEIAKVAFVVAVSSYCALHRSDLDSSRFLWVIGLAALPMVLIYRQPDLGTDLVFAAILIALLLVAGAHPRHLAVLGVIGVLLIVTVLQLGVLKHYQVDRLAAFLDPQGDVQRTTYNLRQSQIAIAAGGLSGKGLFQGSQTNLSFVPEQHTDFIFTAVGEELGFAGAVTLMALFGLVVWRTWRAAVLAKDRFGTLLCVGVLAMIVFQVFENVGMTMGITPIAGIPLPFMSYGGSATLCVFMATGLVLNVHMRRFV